MGYPHSANDTAELTDYLRVLKDNPASLRVMLKNGGRITAEDGEHYFVRIPNRK